MKAEGEDEPMPNTLSCSECHAPVPTDAGTLGLCPRCLMSRAMGGGDGSDGPQEEAASAAPDVSELAGEFPDLEIIGLLGHGGMGSVYSARQRNLDRLVAVKVFSRERFRDPSFEERFRHEGRILASLAHPNVITAHDFGVTPRFFYLVMELVPGPSLRDVLRSGPLSQDLAVRIGTEMCDALQHAHSRGIVHRDIKPENVLLHPGAGSMPDLAAFFATGGRVRVADFGLSRLAQRRTSDYSLTAPAHRLGTPYYMAPEQRERPREVDARADVYAMGVVLYEMLTGELPVGRFPEPSAVAGTDPRLDPVVLRCLEKLPAHRHASAAELRQALATFAQRPAHVSTYSPPALMYATPPPGAISRRPLRIALMLTGAVSIVMILLGAGLFAVRSAKVNSMTATIAVPPPPPVTFPVATGMPIPTAVPATQRVVYDAQGKPIAPPQQPPDTVPERPTQPPTFSAPLIEVPPRAYGPDFGPRFAPRDPLDEMRNHFGPRRVVTVFLDGLPGTASHAEVLERLKALSGATSTYTSTTGSDGKSLTVRLAPVDDIQRLADQITFGKVRDVDQQQRAITVGADPAKLKLQ
jgi:serine/threonine protein kinase